MSRNALEASARSLCFSKAISYELTHEIEEEALTTVSCYGDTSDTISEAIAWELERTFKNGATMDFDPEDKCKRFGLTSSDGEMTDEEEYKFPLPTSATSEAEGDEELKSNCRTHKKARRSLSEKKRSYNWHNPLKNQGNRLKRLQVARFANPKANANAKNSTDKQQKMNSYQAAGDVLDDDLSIDGLFEESGEEEEEVVMFDTEDEAEDSTEDDEDELFVPKKKIRTTPPSTTRQLVNLVQKNMDALSDLAVVSPGKPENIPGYEFSVRLRLAMDKIRYDEAGDMAPEEIVTLHEALAQLEEN